MVTKEGQLDLFETASARSLLDQLLCNSRLYTQSKDYKDLLDFVVHLRRFAPFNAMLLQIQKPGLSYAASAYDWEDRFRRTPKVGARPLLILWPFGPVALVYDYVDTEGEPLPEDVSFFVAKGSVDATKFAKFPTLLLKNNIQWVEIDAGDCSAGSIRVVKHAPDKNEKSLYQMQTNKNHPLPTKLCTLAHELGHLFLGHLGRDKLLNIPDRRNAEYAQREIEAESVAYLVCARNGVTSKSETYLCDYVGSYTTIDDADLYQIMRAAGQVESLLDLQPPYGRHNF